jgi:hypothetical protein
MRCITLDDNLTGLSVFCTGSRVYWVQAHTRYSPSAVDAYQRISLYREDLLWLYFPLTSGETIQDAWICQKGNRGLLENLTLVVRTIVPYYFIVANQHRQELLVVEFLYLVRISIRKIITNCII